MAVIKAMKKSTKSKLTNHKMMRGGEISDNLRRYLARVQEITEDSGYDFNLIQNDDDAKEMFDVKEELYNRWLVEPETVEAEVVAAKAEAAAKAAAAAAAAAAEVAAEAEVAAPALDNITQAPEAAPALDNITQAPEAAPAANDNNEKLIEYDSVVCPYQGGSIGGKLTNKKMKGGAVYTKICNDNDYNSRIVESSSPPIFQTDKTEYGIIYNYINQSYILQNPNIKAFDGKSLNDLLNDSSNSDVVLNFLSNTSIIINNMIFLLDTYKEKSLAINIPVNTAIINTYKSLQRKPATADNLFSRMGSKMTFGLFNRNTKAAPSTALPQPLALPVAGGGQRRSNKSKSKRGGFLDTARVYNTQGLIIDIADPITIAATAGNSASQIPQPFSSRGIGGISYNSDISQEFTKDLLPILGQSGGDKRKDKKEGKKPIRKIKC